MVAALVVSVLAALLIDALAGGALIGGPVAALVLCGLGFVLGYFLSTFIVALSVGCISVLLACAADQVATTGVFAPANDLVFYGALIGFPALIGGLMARRNAQIRLLRDRATELERHREGAVRSARADEAERVEREVDAALADRVTTIIGHVRRAETLLVNAPREVPDELSRVESSARAALADLRDVLGVLRPSLDGTSSRPAQQPWPNSATRSAPIAAHGSRQPKIGLIDAALALSLVPLAVETTLSGLHGPVWLDLLATGAQAAALVAARRRPISGAVALLVVASLQTTFLAPLPSTVSWLLPSVLIAFLVARQLPTRGAVMGSLVVIAGDASVVVLTPPNHRALDSVVPGVVIGALTFWAGRTLRARDSRVTQLATMAAELARRVDAEVKLATLEQRAEMARELHDLGAHVLTVLCLQSVAAQTMWDRDRAAALGALDVLTDLADDSLTYLRESLSSLARMTEQGPEPSIDAASLDVLAGLGRMLGLTVSVHVRGDPRPVPGEAARAAFRVVQESLTNAARHASNGRVEIDLSYAGDRLEITVTDGGAEAFPRTPPIAVTGAGLGLKGLRERVEACRGELATGPSKGGGFTVRALLPLVSAA
jgi:signal transduction histidine kinase